MGIGIWQLLIILLIAIMLFGTRRLRSLGSDLGGAIGGFRRALDDSQAPPRVDEKPVDKIVDKTT
ncbi:twin-arginine translocase TatA/TatE family subunit [Zestomonas carbonaria]